LKKVNRRQGEKFGKAFNDQLSMINDPWTLVRGQ
jgi:hypothetical protein